MTYPASHSESRNWVETILRYIPGFHGYLEKEYRRESDELARQHLSHQLQVCKTGLDRFQRAQVEAGQLELLTACERIRTRIDTLQSRIKGAMQGYSGFFDYVRVDEDRLDRVYQTDVALAKDVAALRESIENITDGSEASLKLSAIHTEVEQLHRSFDKRSELLEGLQ